jgi:hypothetical protein
MTFEPDTGLLVNTSTGTVHKPDCNVVTRTTGRSGPWLAPWKGVAITDTDKPCNYCRPDLDAARAQIAPDASYDTGYQDGESSMMADYVIALDDVWPEDRGDPYPSKVADYIGELQQSIERVTRFAEEHLGTANTGSIQRVLRGEAPFL